MKTYEILLNGEPVRNKFVNLDVAMTWGKSLGATSMITISANGMPGKNIYNPQTGNHKTREW